MDRRRFISFCALVIGANKHILLNSTPIKPAPALTAATAQYTEKTLAFTVTQVLRLHGINDRIKEVAAILERQNFHLLRLEDKAVLESFSRRHANVTAWNLKGGINEARSLVPNHALLYQPLDRIEAAKTHLASLEIKKQNERQTINYLAIDVEAVRKGLLKIHAA